MKVLLFILMVAANAWFLLKEIGGIASEKGYKMDLSFQTAWQDYLMVAAFAVIPLAEDGSFIGLIVSSVLAAVGVFLMLTNYIMDNDLDNFSVNAWALGIMSASIIMSALNSYNLGGGSVVLVPVHAFALAGVCIYATICTFKRCKGRKRAYPRKLSRFLGGRGLYTLIVVFDVIATMVLLSTSMYQFKYNTL